MLTIDDSRVIFHIEQFMLLGVDLSQKLIILLLQVLYGERTIVKIISGGLKLFIELTFNLACLAGLVQ